MAKSPGFWFFTGDWMKDPELRFCSIFARGLLADLLCILFEANEQGYASNPDGTARTDEQIVDAVSGGSQAEKLAALAELEKSGVLSRDSRGVLFSRRIARLAELSKTRKQNGSKGGSKRQANFKQNPKQNTGVAVSVSDSVSDSFLEEIHTHTPTPVCEREPWLGKALDRWVPFREEWNQTDGAEPWHPLTPPSGSAWLECVSNSSWLEQYPIALSKLAGLRRFKHRVTLTQFLSDGWVGRIVAGDFDKEITTSRQTKQRPAASNF